MADLYDQIIDAIKYKNLTLLETVLVAIYAINEARNTAAMEKKNNISVFRFETIDFRQFPEDRVPNGWDIIHGTPIALCIATGWEDGFNLLYNQEVNMLHDSDITILAGKTSSSDENGRSWKQATFTGLSLVDIAILSKQRDLALRAFYCGASPNPSFSNNSECSVTPSYFLAIDGAKQRISFSKLAKALCELREIEKKIKTTFSAASTYMHLHNAFISDPEAVLNYLEHIVNEFVNHVLNNKASHQSNILIRIPHQDYLIVLIDNMHNILNQILREQNINQKNPSEDKNKKQSTTTFSEKDITSYKYVFDAILTHLRASIYGMSNPCWPEATEPLFASTKELNKYIKRNRFSEVAAEERMRASANGMRAMLAKAQEDGTVSQPTNNPTPSTSAAAAAARTKPPEEERRDENDPNKNMVTNDEEPKRDEDDSDRDFDSDKDITVTEETSERDMAVRAAEKRRDQSRTSAQMLSRLSFAINPTLSTADNDSGKLHLKNIRS